VKALFEPRRHRAPTMRAELAAVRAGKKPIAMEAWPAGELDADHAAMLRLARGLEIIERRERGLDLLYVLHHAREAWRVEALHALWRTVPALGWSDGAEALESHLLGYTPAQIERWLADRRHERLGWRGTTIYALLPIALRRSIAHHWFPHDRATLLWCDGTRVIKRRPPVRRGMLLARTAIPDELAAELFPGRGWLRTCELDVAELNPVLERIELLTSRGWR
jgi:hypothetical protein